MQFALSHFFSIGPKDAFQGDETSGVVIMRYLLIVIFLTACAKSGGSSDSNQSASNKDLFSQWSSSSYSLDLSQLQFGHSASIVWILNNGANCTSTIVVNGDGGSGSASISNSHWTGGGSGDPGCSSFNNSWSYQNSGGELTACAQSCEVFH